MVLNPFLEGVIALVIGTALCVVDHYLTIPAFSTTGTLVMGAGAGYILRELGGSSK